MFCECEVRYIKKPQMVKDILCIFLGMGVSVVCSRIIYIMILCGSTRENVFCWQSRYY
jgi:hypothetical protein